MKREIPLLITFVIGVVLIIQFFVPHKPFGALKDTFSDWTNIIGVFAILLGILSLLKVHGEKISRKSQGWGYSIVLIIAFFTTTGVALYSGTLEEKRPGIKINVDAKYKSDLNKGVIPEELYKKFEGKGIKISKYATVELNKENTKWKITDLTHLFAIDIKYQESLDKLTLSEDLLNDFNKNSISLSPDSNVNVQTQGSKWLVLDKKQDRKFSIEKHENTLNVFDLDKNTEYPVAKVDPLDVEEEDNTIKVQSPERMNPFFWIYKYIFTPLSATMFSILAFFVASAAYRAFRAKTAEATLLLLAAFLVMLGRVPISQKVWDMFPRIADWIMKVPNMVGQRAILIGAALGIISASLRILLGLEREYLGRD